MKKLILNFCFCFSWVYVLFIGVGVILFLYIESNSSNFFNCYTTEGAMSVDVLCPSGLIGLIVETWSSVFSFLLFFWVFVVMSSGDGGIFFLGFLMSPLFFLFWHYTKQLRYK